MVERFFEKLAAPVRGLHQAAYVLGALTLVSQILALLRDRVFASAFGAGPTLDLYYASFRIPDLVFALIASLVSAYVLIPRIAGKDPAEVRALLSQSVSFFLLVGGGICVVLALFARELVPYVYPAFAHSPHEDAFVELTRLLLIQPVLLGISGIVTSVTQVHRRFILFALSPVLYNLGIIFGAIVLYPTFGLTGIGMGVVLGAFFHAALHIPVLINAKVFPRIVIPSWSVMRSVVRDSIPRSLALGMGSATLLALTSLASRIAPGSVSVFTLAGNLEAVPLSLIGASYAVAAFPSLSEHKAADDHVAFTRVLGASSRHIVVWSLLLLGLIAVLRAHIVRVILGAGAFDWNATRLTAALLAILTAGLVAQGLVLLFSRALYAAKQSWRPLMYQTVGCFVTVALAGYLLTNAPNGFLSWLGTLLRVDDITETRILVIALAASIGQWLLAIWSLIALKNEAPGLASLLARPFVHGALAALGGGLAAYFVLMFEGGLAPLTTLLAVFTEGFAGGMVGLIAGGLTLYLLKNEEYRDIMRALSRLPGLRSILPPSAPDPAQS